MNNIRIIALFASLPVLLSSCGTGIVRHDDDPTPSVEKLELRASKTVIKADGEDAVQLEVLADGVPVTEGVRLYDGATNLPLELPSMTFTADEPGTYYFWAAYGTVYSGQVSVRAVDFDLPVLPDDPEPDNTSFVRRVLLTQFTGTDCGYCPGMINFIRNLLADEEYSSRVVHTAAHTYLASDPAYLSQRLDQALKATSGYPEVVADMCLSYNNYLNENGFRMMIDEAWERSDAKAGISAVTALHGNTIVVLARVKAAEASEVKVGAWLLEDGIEGRQNNNYPNEWTDDYDTHDNCIRYADSQLSNIDFSGYSLGTLSSGQTAEYVFTINVEDDWLTDNCHVVVFVTVPDEKGFYSVNNAIDLPLNASYPFEYVSE